MSDHRKTTLKIYPITNLSYDPGTIKLIQYINIILDLKPYQKKRIVMTLCKYQNDPSTILTYQFRKIKLFQELYGIYEITPIISTILKS